MRLKVSADKQELRQSYLPSLFPYVVKPLMDNGVVRRPVNVVVGRSANSSSFTFDRALLRR